MNDSERNGLQEIKDKAVEEMAREAGDSFELDRLNLAEFSRRTGLSRSKARTLKAKGFVVTPHGRCGMEVEATVITGFDGVVNALLAEGLLQRFCYTVRGCGRFSGYPKHPSNSIAQKGVSLLGYSGQPSRASAR